MKKEKHMENHLLLSLHRLWGLALGTPLCTSFWLVWEVSCSTCFFSLNPIFQCPYSITTPVQGTSVSNFEPVKLDSMIDPISKGYILQCINPFMDCCPREFVRQTEKFDQSHIHSCTLSWNSSRMTSWGSVSMNNQHKCFLQFKYRSHHKISVDVINPQSCSFHPSALI